jgi:hypothetical protein
MNRSELHPQILLRATVLACCLIAGCAQKMELDEQPKESSKTPPPAASAIAPAPPAPLAEKDCPSAERYKDNICELAKKICGTTDDSAGNVA